MAESALVRFENVDGIGVITVDNPPVNALSPGVPEGIVENVERGNADPAIRGLVVTGRPGPAEEAKRLGIIDELAAEGGDLRQAAIAMARRVADTKPLPRISDRDDKLAEAKTDPGIFDAMRRSITRRARNQKAPYNCIAAVEASCALSFDDGIKRERELFDELENSAE